MTALDTNVLVRLLVRDDVAQARIAERLIERTSRAGESLFVPVTVVLELEWVLRSRYRLTRSDVIETLSALLATVELVFESEQVVEVALASYAAKSADFSDCMHAAAAYLANRQPLWTFDRAAAKIAGARLLGTGSTK